MAIHDISVPLTEQTVTWYNQEAPVKVDWLATVGVDGAECSLSRVGYGSHLGTHVDAPLHFVEGGRTVEALELSTLIGPCVVIEVPHVSQAAITSEVLDRSDIPDGTTRLLFKTENSRRRLMDNARFVEDFVALAPSGAKWLFDAGVRLVGVDYLSVGSAIDGSGGDTHRILLEAGIIVVEGLCLYDIAPGVYNLICLPLKIEGVEGAPVRAVLVD